MSITKKIDTILGFDFGTKYIGIAVGYTNPAMAQPLSNLKTINGDPPWEAISALIKLWSPDVMVVGIPLNMDGSEQTITQIAKTFLENLKERYKLPVYPVDERLTTKEARARLFSSGGYKALQKKAVDSVAAQLIIETWLETAGYE